MLNPWVDPNGHEKVFFLELRVHRISSGPEEGVSFFERQLHAFKAFGMPP
jgi:hypothetical protein